MAAALQKHFDIPERTAVTMSLTRVMLYFAACNIMEGAKLEWSIEPRESIEKTKEKFNKILWR